MQMPLVFRLFAILQNFLLEGTYSSTLEIPVHPNDSEMGVRSWTIKDGAIWLESDDLEKMDVRLKRVC